MADWRKLIIERIAEKDLVIHRRAVQFDSETQRDYNKRIDFFHQHTATTKAEIEKVFDEARKNGLTVTSAHEMFVKEFRRNPPTSKELVFKDTSVPTGWGYEAFEIWGYKWRVDDPELLEDNPLWIYLYLEEHSQFIGVSLKLSTTAKEVEDEIKKWMESNYRHYGFKKK